MLALRPCSMTTGVMRSLTRVARPSGAPNPEFQSLYLQEAILLGVLAFFMALIVLSFFGAVGTPPLPAVNPSESCAVVLDPSQKRTVHDWAPQLQGDDLIWDSGYAK